MKGKGCENDGRGCEYDVKKIMGMFGIMVHTLWNMMDMDGKHDENDKRKNMGNMLRKLWENDGREWEV